MQYSIAGTMAVLALASTAAFADNKAPAAPAAAAPAAPAAPAELAQLDYFGGNWNCTGKAFASPMAPEHATAATVHATKAAGGRWQHVTYDETKTAANPAPYHVGVYWGYDAAKKSFIQFCVDNFGGYCNQTSTGWNGDTMIFEGTGNGDGKQFGARDTFVKKDANTMTHAGEMQGDDKKWNKTDEETCKRAK